MNKEEAAKNYASVTDPEEHGIDFMCEVFIAGAKWDREQMMKETVEGEYGYFSNASKTILPCGKLNLKEGDKIKIIIVKEDEK